MALADDARLHKLCQDGDLSKIKDFVNQFPDRMTLDDRLANRKGVFGYTPLHEAVASGHHDVLDCLLRKAGDSHVNCRANSGYTPLHLAASSGHGECVRVLLKHNADISVTDEYGKTPKQTAELSSKNGIVRILRGAEIINEVKRNGNITELLEAGGELEPNCLNEALVAAVQNDHQQNVGKLIAKGANNISAALKLSVTEKKHYAGAMLLLIYAAIEGNCNLVRQLFGEIKIEDQPCQECSKSNGGTHKLISHMLNDSISVENFHDCLLEVRRALERCNMPTAIPIEIARRTISKTPQKARRCAHVREELLMKTDVNKDDKSVQWQGLDLRSIEISWLKRIDWVETLLMGHNQLSVLPEQIGLHLQQVTKLDFQNNDLKKIPGGLFTLPCIVELNLSYNKIKELPSVQEWSPSLTTLNLAFNSLTSFPDAIEAPSMMNLSLAHNHFQRVPKSICSFSSLQSLDLSDNQDILALPAEMGRLAHLFNLNLTNLKDLHDPPKAVQGDARDCIRYLNQKLQNASRFYRMKLMLVGYAERGKSTIVAALQGEKYDGKPSSRTVGVDVSDWSYSPTLFFNKTKFHFSIWDFGGQEEYYATHQCFLSKRSIYLLVFNLTHQDAGVQELKPWLNNIALRAPGSCVIIVGTHLDLMQDRKATTVSGILHKVKRLVQGYKKVIVSAVVPVALQQPLENISLLKETIYNAAAEYKYKSMPVMGQLIPASYHELDKRLRLLRKESRREKHQPIMHRESFKSMVQQMDLGIHDDGELKTATLFLRDVGTLLHYDDCQHNLHELYFIDPHWLCKMMAKIVAPDPGRNGEQFIKDGILHKENIKHFFPEEDKRFPVEYFHQYLTLLYRFEIALPLDNSRILITSMLDRECKSDVDIDDCHDPPFHTRYITFGSSETPPGFWSRYLSRIMHSVSKAADVLKLNTPGSVIASLSLGVSVDSSHQLSAQVSPLKYWESGLFFSDSEVTFRVQALSGLRLKYPTEEDGIQMITSPNTIGIKIMGQLVDLAMSLLRDMYPGLTEIKQRIPCYDCVRMHRTNPYEFKVEECWLAMEEQRSTIECGYDRQDPTKNHTMSISIIAPDLLLQDIDAKFLLNQSEIKKEETLLTRPTEYEKICKGMCRGSFVTITYPFKTKEALRKLRSEVQILQKSHHPCLTCLIGVVVHPRVAIVIEKAPENSLEWPLIKQQSPIHRITLFRIATQVSAALRFLHKNGILFRDLKASNVLMWTFNQYSLCHCKLGNSAIATQLYPTGAKGLHGTKGFIAPEVLHIGWNTGYNEKADIFSFAMLLYQIVSRKYPFYELNEDKHLIRMALLKGDRPKLQKETCGTMAYHYLIHLMKKCWDGDPQNRPCTNNLIKYLCLSSTQAVMSIVYTRGSTRLRQAHVVKTPCHRCNDIWVFSDGSDSLEIDIYNLSTLKKAKSHPIRNAIFSAMCFCKDHIWIATRDGISYGILEIFNPDNQRQVYRVPQWDYMVSCITCSDNYVYIGTMDGFCFSFPIDLKRVRQNPKPRKRELPEEDKAIADILFVSHAGSECVWVSQTRYLYFLQPENLAIDHAQYRGHTDDLVGKLATPSNDTSIVWSAHIGGSMLTAWDVSSRSMKFEINTASCMEDICPNLGDTRSAITAMACASDTVWLGMTTGHILIFAEQELLTWYHPYSSYVQFITAIPGPGPCKTEECMVLTGGQKLNSLIPFSFGKIQADKSNKKEAAMILWEAFNKQMTQQIKYIEDKAPEIFENHKTLRDTIKKEYLGFKDGTRIMQVETFNVQLLGQREFGFELLCPKPVKLATLLEKIWNKANAHNMTCKIEYRDSVSGECIEIRTQEDLENYVKLEDRPQLLCHLLPLLAP